MPDSIGSDIRAYYGNIKPVNGLAEDVSILSKSFHLNFSPYEITLLLHIYAVAEPPRTCPILDGTLERFRCMGLIEAAIKQPAGHSVTDKGAALIEHWCSTPVPTCRWEVHR